MTDNAGRRPLVRKLKHVCWVLVLDENWSLYIVVNPFMIGSHQISFAVVCTLLSELFPLECRPCQACQGDIGADIRRKCAAARKCEDIERGTMGVNNTGNPQLEPSLPASAPPPHDYPTISDSRAAPFPLLDLCISKRAFHQAFHDSKSCFRCICQKYKSNSKKSTAIQTFLQKSFKVCHHKANY